MENVSVIIQNGQKGFEPIIMDNIQWETERKGSPGKLTLKVYQDGLLDIEEGNVITLKVDDTSVFYGYIFKRTMDKTNVVSLTCYDQMRYLKNKDTYNFKSKTAKKIISSLCKDFGLKVGKLANTGYTIKAVVYDSKTLLDMMQDALEMTLTNTKKLFVLYDDFGKMTLKNVDDMRVGLVIDADTAESFDFEATIDSNVYNKIRLMYEDSETHKREFWTVQDKKTQKKWGILQYYESISKEETEGAKKKAKSMLSLYNQEAKHLTIKDCIGDLRVRAGSMVVVQMTIGTEEISNWMVVDKCTHTFKENEHFMTLKLIGGGFIG